MAAYHLIIKGKVQGVFFRATAKDVAEKLGIKGWVKNTEEGNVEAWAEGIEDAVQQFIQWCKKGPSKAIVTEVIISDAKEQHVQNFKILRS